MLKYSGAYYDYSLETGLPILIPNKEFNYQKECLMSVVKTNSDGFHDKEFVKEKPENTYRIVVLGDSIVQAMEVSLQTTFHKQLEEKLNQNSSKKIEVYALGRSGNGSLMNYLFLKKYALDLNPDLIIHLFMPVKDFRDDSPDLVKKYIEQTGDHAVNLGKIYPTRSQGNVDFNQALVDLEKMKVNRKPRAWYVNIARSSAFIGFVKRKYALAKASLVASSQINKPENIDSLVVPVDYEVFKKETTSEWLKAFTVEGEILKEMKRLSQSEGIDYLLVAAADSFRVHKNYLNTSYWDEKQFDEIAPEKFLKRISKENNISFLALIPYFESQYSKNGEQIDYSCDGHWNKTGHRLAAEALYEFLKNKL